METRYPAAAWRPLGPQLEPGIGVPRVLVFHTAVGYLQSTDAMFRKNGYTGTESHFGVGGPWDGAELDGAVWQWQALDHQADAQGPGNAYATSIETMDGGNPDRPWSSKQLDALTALGAWWCRQTGNPARLVTSPSGNGFGYHSQFTVWNPNSHSCPNPTRIAQLKNSVIPGVAAALRAGKTPTPPVEDDMPLTDADVLKVRDAILGAGFGRDDRKIVLGQMFSVMYQAAVTQPTVDQIADAVIARLSTSTAIGVPSVGGLTKADVRAAVVDVLHSVASSTL